MQTLTAKIPGGERMAITLLRGGDESPKSVIDRLKPEGVGTRRDEAGHRRGGRYQEAGSVHLGDARPEGVKKKPKRFTALTCPKCKVKLWLLNHCGIILWRDVDGRKVYDGQCPGCGRKFEIDRGKVPPL